MSEINITVEGGTSKRLLTAGKYCDRDIVVTAEGGGGEAQPHALLRKSLGYIDTGVPGNNSNLKIEIRYEMTVMPTGYFSVLYAYTNESTNATRITYNKSAYVYACLNSVPSSSLSVSGTRYANVVYTDILRPNSSTVFSYTSNGVEKTMTRKSGTELGGKTIALFNKATTADGVDIMVYYLKIYDGDELIRDFVPAIQGGAVGLYDKVYGQFYGNDGDGTFEAV